MINDFFLGTKLFYKKNKEVFIFSLVLLIIYLYISNVKLKIIFLFFSVLIPLNLIYLCAFLGILGFAFAGVLLAIISVEIGFKIQFGERVSEAILKSLLESIGNSKGNLSILSSFSVLIISSTIFTILLLIGFYFVRKNRSKGILYSLSIFSIVAISLFLGKMIYKDHRFIPDVKAYPELVGTLFYERSNLLLGDVAVIITDYLTKLTYAVKTDKTSPVGIMKQHTENQLVVFVLGESSLSKRYSIYGYDKVTTPYLSSLIQRNDVCYFDNVHSSAPITRDSIAMTLSFHTPENITPFFEQKSVIELAKDNGYKSYWLSSQGLIGLYDTKYAYLVQDSDIIKFTNWEDNRLPILLSEILSTKGKKFIILHMSGNHMPYQNQYDSIDNEQLTDADDYDKSIHKTDRIIHEIIEILNTNQSDYTLFFTSDHGEIVGKGHGMLYGSSDQYLIPYVFKSTKNHEQVCQFVSSLRNKNGYISALNNKFILLNMLGYSIDDIYLRAEVENDRVLHSDGRSYQWQAILQMNRN